MNGRKQPSSKHTHYVECSFFFLLCFARWIPKPSTCNYTLCVCVFCFLWFRFLWSLTRNVNVCRKLCCTTTSIWIKHWSVCCFDDPTFSEFYCFTNGIDAMLSLTASIFIEFPFRKFFIADLYAIIDFSFSFSVNGKLIQWRAYTQVQSQNGMIKVECWS